jgi:energy-coupling factor transporter transmembrane protein EcfT
MKHQIIKEVIVMFTIAQWVVLVFLLLIGLGISLAFFVDKDTRIAGLVIVFSTVVVTVLLAIFLNWYNTSTASGIRGMKDFRSNLSNGIEREITITTEDGREVFHYQGKIDVESDHTDNYIKFESEDGKRYIIYYGIQDTVKIIEK